jgi:uncharacterized FlgJ-related protein
VSSLLCIQKRVFLRYLHTVQEKLGVHSEEEREWIMKDWENNKDEWLANLRVCIEELYLARRP